MKIFTLLFLPALSVIVIVLLCRVLSASGHGRDSRTIVKYYLRFNAVYGPVVFSMVAVLVLVPMKFPDSLRENIVLAVLIITTAGFLNRMRMFRSIGPDMSGVLLLSASAVSAAGVLLSFMCPGRSVSIGLKIAYVIFLLAGLLLMVDRQCRLIIRLEKERIGREVLKAIWMMVELILADTVFLFVMMDGFGDEKRCLAVICLAALFQTLHSVEAALDVYPSVWYENKLRQLIKKIEMNEINGKFEEQDGMVVRLTEYFETKKPFLSPDLCLSEVAVALMTNKTTLSRVIHHQMKMSFRELVNRFRIKEAIAIFANNMFLDVAELARMSGFRNNASFTNAFKLNIGKTPGAWCKEYKEQRNEIWKKEVLETCYASDRNKKREGCGYEPVLPKGGIDEPIVIP